MIAPYHCPLCADLARKLGEAEERLRRQAQFAEATQEALTAHVRFARLWAARIKQVTNRPRHRKALKVAHKRALELTLAAWG